VSENARRKKNVGKQLPKNAARCGKSIDDPGAGETASRSRIHLALRRRQLAHFSIEGEHAQAARTFFTQEILERGFLASNAFYANYAHSDGDVEAYAAM
jgi:glutamate-1-semialdehyde 2,1-aminomutase